MENTVTIPLSDFIIIMCLCFMLGVLLTLFTAASFELRRISKKLKELSEWNLSKPKKS